MRLFLGISVLSMLACAGGVKDKGEDPADDSAGASDDSGGGGGGGGGGGSGLFGPCADYGMAFGEGTEWVYSVDVQTQTGTLTSTIIEQSGGQLRIESVAEYDIPDFDYYTSTSTSNYNCASDGLYLNLVRSTTVYSYNGQEQIVESTVKYDDPYFVVPDGLKVGSTWTAEGVGTTTTDQGDTEFDYFYECEIKLKEDVDVEAGSFSTLKQVCQSADGTKFISWLAKGVGSVQTDTSELVSYSN
jgi:hypothetical protein